MIKQELFVETKKENKAIPLYHQSNLVHAFKCRRKFSLSLDNDIKKSRAMDDGNLFEGLVFGFKDQHYQGANIKRGFFSTIEGVNPSKSGKICDLLIDNGALTLNGDKQLMTDLSVFKSKISDIDFSELNIEPVEVLERAKEALTTSVDNKTLETYKRCASFIREKYFQKGKPYQKISWQGDKWGLEGEADWIGEIEVDGVLYKDAIPDLKFTGSIEKIWISKENPEDFLQSVVYPYIHWKNTGIVPTFVYIVVENIKSLPDDVDPLCKAYVITPDIESFQWLESFVEDVHNDWELAPNSNECITGPYWNVKCPYLLKCKTGRRLIEQTVKFSFSDLIGESQ